MAGSLQVRPGKLIGALVGLGVVSILVGASVALSRDDGLIIPGVSVQGRALGGLSKQAAQALLTEYTSTQCQLPIELRAADQRWRVLPSELGISPQTSTTVGQAFALGRKGNWIRRMATKVKARVAGAELPLTWEIDQRRFEQALGRITGSISIPSRSASAHLVEGKVQIVPEQIGWGVDLSHSLAAFQRLLQDGLPGQAYLSMSLKFPRVRTSDLSQVNGVVAAFSTSFGGSSWNRQQNIRQAAKAIDGTVLLPGDIFSYNKTVGRRTIRLGYRIAPILVNGELVPGAGGGVCQVSSTLYNVALLANFKILQRSHHSSPVRYISPGRDATVNYGSIDLVFQNTTSHPVVLRAQTSRSRLLFEALGHLPIPPVRITTLRSGLRVTVVRVVGKGKEEKRETISQDTYRPYVKRPKPEVRPKPRPEAEPGPAPHLAVEADEGLILGEQAPAGVEEGAPAQPGAPGQNPGPGR